VAVSRECDAAGVRARRALTRVLSADA
jgi:hypothetical protein